MSRPLILWDFDGTLADTLTLALATYNRLAAKYAFRRVEDPQAVRQLTMREFLKAHDVPAWRVPGLFAQFLRDMNGSSHTVRLFPGIHEALRKLQLLGYRHVVVSSNSTDNIRKCLHFNSVADLFEDVCGTSQLFGKQHRIRRALLQCRTPQHHCLYLGDEVRDIEAAQAAGITVGCVGWGLNAPQVLKDHGPAFLAEHVRDLVPLIRRHQPGHNSARDDSTI